MSLRENDSEKFDKLSTTQPGYCSMSIKFGTDLDHVLQTLKLKGSKVKVTA